MSTVEQQAEEHAEKEWSRYHGDKEVGFKAAKYSFLEGHKAASSEVVALLEEVRWTLLHPFSSTGENKADLVAKIDAFLGEKGKGSHE